MIRGLCASCSLGLLGALVGACAVPDITRQHLPSIGAFSEMESPAGPDSGEPFLFAAADRLIVSWLQAAGDDHEFRFSFVEPGGETDSWSEPRTIVRRPDLFVNWADFPSVIELPDGTLSAHWLQYTGPGTYSYGVQIVRSADDGATWSYPVVPYADTSLTEHGFVVLFPGELEPGSAVRAVWLDGRDYANEAADPPFMMLRGATVNPDGTLADEAVLDPMTCDCCQNSVALTSEGPVVAYRGRTRDEVRDIRVVRGTSDGWSEPVTVHDDMWEIPACPVNGPAIVASGETVAVTWFTNADETPRVLTAFSADGGRSFGAPVRVDDGRPLGRVDAVMLEDGVILASWLEVGEDGSEVRLRAIAADGRAGDPVSAGHGSAERAGGFPRMAVWHGKVILAWTIPGEPSTIRLAAAKLSP